MAAVIAAEADEMLGIRGEIGNPGIDHAARALGQLGKPGMTTRFARSFEDEPQSLLDQIPELAPAQRRLCLGSTVELVGDFDSSFHWCLRDHITIKPYLWQSLGGVGDADRSEEIARTGSFKNPVQRHVKVDKKFAEALLREGVDADMRRTQK
jgi:hypothetical protein